MNVGDALQEGTAYLRLVTDTPRLEAELLLSSVIGLSRASLLAHPDQLLTLPHRTAYLSLLHSRASGYPLPYLIQHVEFYGLEFAVTSDVLIPRPETETLVDLARQFQPRRIVDVGTGSGCIAVALAVHLPQARVFATDISASALRVAAANAHRHGVRERVHLVCADLVTPFAGPVDLVVSNPPYVAGQEWLSLPVSVWHEPRLALDGGADGLEVVRRLLVAAPRILRPGGTLLVEIGAAQGQAATALARALVAGSRVVVHPDMAGRDRILELTLDAPL
jgi:release factor glutamine methyltransferase